MVIEHKIVCTHLGQIPNACIFIGKYLKFRFELGGSYAIFLFEQFAEVGGSKAHLTGNIVYRHFRMCSDKLKSNLHSNRIDVLWKRHAIGIGVK